MTYTNTLTLAQISDMMMSISNSLYQMSKNIPNLEHAEMVQRLYRDAVIFDNRISTVILTVKPTNQEVVS